MIFKQLEGTGRRPSDEVIDAILSVCEASMEKAESLDKSQTAFEALRGIQLHACTRAYNAIIQACAKWGDWKAAQMYFEEMMKVNENTSDWEGMEFNEGGYTSDWEGMEFNEGGYTSVWEGMEFNEGGYTSVWEGMEFNVK